MHQNPNQNQQKPTEISKAEKLQALIKQSGLEDLAEEMGIALPSIKTKKLLEEFITCDVETIELKEKVYKLSPLDIPVMLIGETGTGKELLAKALHGERSGEFVAVNTAGIPDTLLESELFGVDRGAFTGSINKPGLLEEAKDGTLFLDEIGDMPMLMQCKMLRVIQEKKARRLGSIKEYQINCRFIAATNKCVAELLQEKNIFRKDLYYRFPIKLNIKPLRDRIGDIELICKKMNVEHLLNYFIGTKDKFSGWPGNVRELLNYIEEDKIFNKK